MTAPIYSGLKKLRNPAGIPEVPIPGDYLVRIT
jgi:hypothetical protein